MKQYIMEKQISGLVTQTSKLSLQENQTADKKAGISDQERIELEKSLKEDQDFLALARKNQKRPDTIPGPLKCSFFMSKLKAPDLMKDYDVLGFNVEHCMAPFNQEELTRVLCESYITYLHHQKGYPEDILDFNYANINVTMNNAVWDITNGNVLKLDEYSEVINAVHGFEVLSHTRIEELYGAEEPVFKHLQFPETNKMLQSKEGAHWTLMGFFECAKVPLICHLTEMIKAGQLPGVNYLQLAFDLQECDTAQMTNYTEDQVVPLEIFGNFYPKLVNNPGLFLQKNYEMRHILSTMKKQGKKTFLMSNLHVDFVEFVMDYTLGNNWQSYFEVICVNTRKPLFQRAQANFYTVDKRKPNYKGKTIQTVEEFEQAQTKMFLEGNYNILLQYFQRQLDKQDVKIVSFGENILTDIQATYEFNEKLQQQKSPASWEAIAIVQEFLHHEPNFCRGIPANLIKHNQDYWGAYYFYRQCECCSNMQKPSNKDEYQKRMTDYDHLVGQIRNYFVHQMSLSARYAVPLIKNINNLMLMADAPQKAIKPLVDPKKGTSSHLLQTEAESRANFIQGVHYSVCVFMSKSQTFKGNVVIEFMLKKLPENDQDSWLFVDYRGKQINSVKVNGVFLDDPTSYHSERIHLPQSMAKIGRNYVEVYFESEYVTDCYGVHRYHDKEDGEQYIYTNLEPSNCHNWFPCFDQPDLKAKYKLLVGLPASWRVISTCSEKSVSKEIDQQTKADYRLTGKQIKQLTASLLEEKHYVVEFEESQPLSTYLYSLVAGPFHMFQPAQVLESDKAYRLFCRQSLKKYVAKISEDWFRVTRAGIKYYEKLFDTKYPFGKLDQVFAPDFQHGAMENVGCIIYRDEYVQKDEQFNRVRQEGIYGTILHEISHMWFGNLVTMKWWDDLWLNEAFATMIAHKCMDEAEGLEDIKYSWNIFQNCQRWGLTTDQKDSTHSIQSTCLSTADAEDMFDGISYGKGASFLKQLLHFFGKEVIIDGLRSYFKKYAFKNTTKEQFLQELSLSAKKHSIQEDLTAFCEEWLSSAGCSEIHIEPELYRREILVDNFNLDGMDIATDKIKRIKVIQTPYGTSKSNRLRAQKFSIAYFDENMKIKFVASAQTKADRAMTSIPSLTGEPMPEAFLLNYGSHGFGKFVIDGLSLSAFEHKLHMVEDVDARKVIYNTVYDMTKSGKAAGSQLLKMILSHLPVEQEEIILVDVLKNILPALISRYIPINTWEQVNAKLFDMVHEILKSEKFKHSISTSELLIQSLVQFAVCEPHLKQIHDWFYYFEIYGIKNRVQLRHLEMRKIWQARELGMHIKQKAMEHLEVIDSSDRVSLTKRYCEAVNPTRESKEKVWEMLFNGPELDLYSTQILCSGFRKISQRWLCNDFKDKWFQNIERIVSSKAVSVAKSYFFLLCPDMEASDEEIERFQKFLSKLQGYKEDQKSDSHRRLVKWMIQIIGDLKEKQSARKTSENWSDGCEKSVYASLGHKSRNMDPIYQSLQPLKYPGAPIQKPPLNKEYLRLYGHHLCPFTAKVRYALAAKNIQFQSVEMELKNKASWHVEFNQGTVPILETPQGSLIGESGELMMLANEMGKDNGLTLIPESKEQANQIRVLMIKFNDLMPLWFKVMETRGMNEEVNEKFAEVYPKLNDLAGPAGRGKWLANTDHPTMLDIHCAPFWEYMVGWMKGHFDNVTTDTDFQFYCPNVIKFVHMFKSHPVFKDICMRDEALVKHQEQTRKWDETEKCPLGLKVLEGIVDGHIITE